MTIKKKCQEVHQKLNLQDCIKALLLEADSRRLTHAYLAGQYVISSDLLVKLLRHVNKEQSLDQLRAVAGMFFSQWIKEGDTHAHVKYAEQPTIFNMLLHFVDNGMLHLENNENPVCRWDGLLRWNDLTKQIGEDVMVCAFLAGHDLVNTSASRRMHFNWNPFIKCDDPTINMMLEMPLADVHAHLNGSSLNFDINWICLMNHIKKRKKVFAEISNMIQSEHMDDNQEGGELYQKALIAAIIRLYLLECIYPTGNKLAGQLDNVMRCDSVDQIIKESASFQDVLEDAKRKTGARYTSENGISEIFDYAIIPGVCKNSDDSYTLLSGERFLLYSLLKNIYSGQCQDEKISFLLLLYLVIKNEIRHEITQLNDMVGFDNFSIYERRKLIFAEDYDYYERAALHLAIKGFFYTPKPNNRYHEVRIVPKDTGRDIVDNVISLDNAIESDMLKKENVDWTYRYIFHFIKRPDAPPSSECRHFKLREIVKKKSRAIFDFRNTHTQKKDGTFIVDRVVGIDAANSEIACRPEVFAQAFRFLRHHSVKYPNIYNPHDLGITYHVGEDYMDVVDGLRAVTEAILFLQLEKGDRIGHGLVLGVDVDEYYRSRNRTVSLTRQMLMDNMAWLYHYVRNIKRYGHILGEIKEEFERCYRIVYEGRLVPSIDVYYDSMLLRGDNPEWYMEDGTVNNFGGSLDEWLSKSLNTAKECCQARELRESRMLYHQYHYDKKGKEKGNEYIEWMVTDDVIGAIKVVQNIVLSRVEALGLAIECNPTSNIKIGEFDRYDEHPIMQFNNEGLGSKARKALSVSINTDDRGVFSTSIEREYALMAHAVIRYFRQNDNGVTDNDVYNWLDRIRRYSLSQRFDKTDSHFDEPTRECIEDYRKHILKEAKLEEESNMSWFAKTRKWIIKMYSSIFKRFRVIH